MGEVVPYPFLKRLRIRNKSVREFLAEFLGTFILILFGDGAFAAYILTGKGVSDVFAVTWGWGIGVMLGVTISMGVSGGHINPAVTVAFATLGKLPWRKVPHYLLAQHLGAFVGSAVLFFNYKDFLDHLDPGRTVTPMSSMNRTAHIWATYPEPWVSIGNCFLDQIVGTGILMFTALAIIDKKNSKIPSYLHPVFLGFMICALAMCFGLNCMAPLNPARDFSTRIFTAIAGYGLEVFTYRNYWWIGLVPTHLGAIIGGWLYYLGVELHCPDPNEDEEFGKDHLELSMPLNSSSSDRKGTI